MMFTRHLWLALLTFILASTIPAGAHQGGVHPTGLDECEDVLVALEWFYLHGYGVVSGSPQDHLKPQEYTLKNETPDGYAPRATIRIAWALGSMHTTRYDDFVVTIYVGNSRSYVYNGNQVPTTWVIKPYIDGWSGTFRVVIEHKRCNFSVTARAKWSMENPCASCPILSCAGIAEIKSVNIRIPVGVTDYGRSPVQLEYLSEQIENEGVSKVAFRGAIGTNGSTVHRTDGIITGVTTGDHYAALVPDPTPEDPERFRIDVSYDKNDPANTIYRQAIVENIVLPDNTPAIRYTDSVGGRTDVHVFTRPTPDTWVLEDNGLRRTTKTKLSESPTTRVHRFEVEEIDASGSYALVSRRDEHETRYAWGWEKSAEVRDPGGETLTTTWDYYDRSEFSGPNGDITGRGQLQSVTDPTGSTRSFEYHDTDPLDPSFAKLTISREPSAVPPAGAPAGTPGVREIRRHSTSNGITLSERLETWINGTLVAHTDIAASATGSTPWRTETSYPAEGGPPHVTRFEYESSPHTLLEQTIAFPDGTVEVVTGSYAGGIKTSSVYRGVDNPSSNGLPILTGTEERTVTNETGQVLESGSYRIRNGGAFRVEERVADTLDELSRPTITAVFQGAEADPVYMETTEYGCCGISRLTGRDGIPMHYFYDPLGRLTKTHQNGLATETIYDGLTTRSHKYAEEVASSLSLATDATETASLTLNLAGDTVVETSRSPQDNSLVGTLRETVYNPGGGLGRRVVRTFPQTPDDLGVLPTITEDYYLDGQLATRTGPLVADRQTTYSANSDGIASTISYLDASGDSYQPVTIQYDWMGRPVSQTFAGDADDDGQPDREVLFHDLGGRTVKHIDPDGVTRLWSYDLLNETSTLAIDLNANGLIDPDIDEVRSTRAGISLNGDSRIIMWSENLVRETAGNDTLVTRSETRADGLESWLYSHAGGSSALTHSLTTRLPGSPGGWDTTIRHPDDTTLVQRIRGGLLATEVASDASGNSLITRTYHHDAQQRVFRIDDSSGPSLEASYLSPLVDVVTSRRIGSLVTSFTRDHRGRLTMTDAPDSLDATGASIDNRRVASYWPHGGPREVNGTPGYRQVYTYDDAHRLESLTTFGTTAATTRWQYDPGRGWLTRKRFNSPSAGEGSGPASTYSPAGRLEMHTSQRSIVTNHTYGPDGRLTRTDYSDGTASTVIHERDRRGRVTRLSDAGGERLLSYDNQSALAAETYQPGHLLAGWGVHQDRDAVQRLSGLTLRANGIERHHAGYAYDGAGRLATVEADELAAFYHYDPDHLRVGQMSVVNVQGAILHSNRSYDALKRIKRISYHDGDLHGALDVYSDYQYERNAYGRITTATLRDQTQWRYGYHPSGELASAKRFLDAASPTLVAGHAHTWSFDGLGNRVGSARGGDASGTGLQASTYTPNALNQLTAIQRPGAAEIFGEAPLGAEVTVNGSPATRDGNFFRFELTPDNSAGPVWQAVTIQSGGDTSSGHLLIPPALAAPTHDLDGNLQYDGVYDYSWDAENRLTGVETSLAATAAGIPYTRLAYTYDADGRRLKRLRFDSPGATTPAASTRYLYAGWRCLGELDAAGQLTRTLTWGLDNNDSLHLGDGNGALLWLHDQASDETHLAHFDGNGNISSLSSAQSRQQTAHYLYSPFGKLLAATGPYAKQNPYRFSTHYQDPTTGLIDYGFRHLDPENGRWLSRDPLGEFGGVNLYGLAGNDAVNQYDVLGRQPGRRRNARKPKRDAYVARNGTTPSGVSLIDMVRRVSGFGYDILSGDLYNSRKVSTTFNQTQCEFLITATGINTPGAKAGPEKNGNLEHLKKVRDLPQYRHIPNPTYVDNPSGGIKGIGDFAQIVADTAGFIQITSARLADTIKEAYDQAVRNKCPADCIKIHIVAHSQGTAIVKGALPLLPEHVKRAIHYVGIGGQKYIAPKEVGQARNIENQHDIVPLLPNQLSDFSLEPVPGREVFKPDDVGLPSGQEAGPFSGHTLGNEVTGKDNSAYYLYLEQYPTPPR